MSLTETKGNSWSRAEQVFWLELCATNMIKIPFLPRDLSQTIFLCTVVWNMKVKLTRCLSPFSFQHSYEIHLI